MANIQSITADIGVIGHMGLDNELLEFKELLVNKVEEIFKTTHESSRHNIGGFNSKLTVDNYNERRYRLNVNPDYEKIVPSPEHMERFWQLIDTISQKALEMTQSKKSYNIDIRLEKGFVHPGVPYWHLDYPGTVVVNFGNRADWTTRVVDRKFTVNYKRKAPTEKEQSKFDKIALPVPLGCLINTFLTLHRSPNTTDIKTIGKDDYRLFIILWPNA